VVRHFTYLFNDFLGSIMSDEVTSCPKCNSENIYEDGALWICPECSHEWSAMAAQGDDGLATNESSSSQRVSVICDAHGTPLADGDSVTVIKALKVKGSSSVVKVGTKVRSIRLIDADDGHDIACKIDGIGAINLKSELVKKA
jgi:protein PhnA